MFNIRAQFLIQHVAHLHHSIALSKATHHRIYLENSSSTLCNKKNNVEDKHYLFERNKFMKVKMTADRTGAF